MSKSVYREDLVTVMSELFDYDAELLLHNELFRIAARIGPRDRVLDIGCGTGQSTREAAHAAVSGSTVGVDISAQMLEQARRLSDDQGLSNTDFIQADAQIHHFPLKHFDLCIRSLYQPVRNDVLRPPGRRVYQYRARSAPSGTTSAAGLAKPRPQ